MAIREPKKHSAATEAQLWLLWGGLKDACFAMLREPEKLTGEKLHIIRSFLRDNGVVSDPAKEEDIRKSLEQLSGATLPFDPDPSSRM